jgi:CubicO group peptidase (beta-lactamase class C family)
VRYLPGLQVPERNGRAITLADLATHTSGLPLRPSNLVSTDPDNKYAGYTHAHLARFLATFVLPRDPGASYEYSNIGYAVLGEAVSHAAGQPYAELVQARIAGPLGLRDTRLVPSKAMQARAAIGYDAELKPAKHWDMGVLAPAGGLRSTAHDLMRLLEAQLGIRDTPLAKALAATIATRRPGGMPPSTISALGWNLNPPRSGGGNDVIWKNGSVGGYRAFIGFDPEARIGVVALANAQTPAGVDDLGLHVLDPAFPVDLHIPKPHKAIALAPAVLDRYVGRYKFSDADILVVTRDGAQLYGESPGIGKYPLYAEAERAFFLKLFDAQVSFVGGPRATEAVWHERDSEQRGKRID